VSEHIVGKLRAASRPVFICLLLAAATLAVFWPVTGFDFVNYDDPDYFSSNDHVRLGLTLNNIVWAFRTVHASNWHPLTWLSLMLDAQLFGKGPAGPHFTNLLLHTANIILLFLLLRKLTSAIWRSAFVAALFALHPLHVESVAWISERKDVLSAFFALLALIAYARFVEESKVQNPKSKAFYVLTLLAFACGLMSKPMLVTLPFVMLLLDWWPLGRVAGCRLNVASSEISQPSTFNLQPSTFARLILEKIPFFVLSAISCVVTFVVQKKSGAVATLTGFSMPDRIENAFVSYARYLGKTLWPDPLAVPYPFPGHWGLSLVIYSVALLAGLSAIAILYARKFPFMLTGWFWFVGMLIPVVGVVQVGSQSMADRYTYLPLIGVFIIFAWGADAWCANWRVPRPLVIFVAAIILAACAARTRDQLGYWQNGGTLFRHALAVTENNTVACNNFGAWLVDQGQTDEAMDFFQKSLRMNPDNAATLYNLGEIQARLGNLDAAENYYRHALQIDPDYADALYNLGNALTRLGRVDEAIANYRHALQVDPDRADVLDNLGFALAAGKQFAEAVTNFEAALKLDPDFADAHNNLATVLFTEHKFAEAAQHYREAIRLAPGNARIYANLGDTLVRLGKIPEAAQNYQTALRLKPDDAKTRAKLQALGAQISN
jgi:Flp pilus assembly protein TadD